MTVRELPQTEWHRLEGVDLGIAVPFLTTETATIMVVEEGDEIVGCWALLTVHHAEGVWVHPRYRGKTSVARRLWTQMHRTAARLGIDKVITGACEPVIARLLEHHGATKLEMDSYVLPLKGRS